MICRTCGANIPDFSRQCPNCGAPMQQPGPMPNSGIQPGGMQMRSSINIGGWIRSLSAADWAFGAGVMGVLLFFTWFSPMIKVVSYPKPLYATLFEANFALALLTLLLVLASAVCLLLPKLLKKDSLTMGMAIFGIAAAGLLLLYLLFAILGTKGALTEVFSVLGFVSPSPGFAYFTAFLDCGAMLGFSIMALVKQPKRYGGYPMQPGPGGRPY